MPEFMGDKGHELNRFNQNPVDKFVLTPRGLIRFINAAVGIATIIAVKHGR